MDAVPRSRDDSRSDRGPLARLGHRIARWRTPLVVMPLIGALIVAGGIGARMMIAGNHAAVGETTTVTCWDAARVVAPSDCSEPTGKAGLRWVFPSFRPGRPDCADDRATDPDLPRPVQWTCSVRVTGRTAEITYFQLADLRAGLRFHARLYRSGDREKVVDGGETVRLVWRRQSGDAYDLVAAYADHPYAVGIVAPTARVRERALRTVRFRQAGAISARAR